jgi:type IV secretion system protein VirD4
VITVLARMLLVMGLLAFVWAAAACLITFSPLSWCIVIGAVLVAMAKRSRGGWWAFGTSQWAGWSHVAGPVCAAQGVLVGRLAYGLPTIWQAALAVMLWPPGKAEAACSLFLQSLRRKKTGPLIRLPKAINSVLFAPVGAGKSTGVIIPQLLTNSESAVVIDFKGELARATSVHRRRVFRHRIVLLDPFCVVTHQPDSFNPLDFIKPDSPDLIDATRDLAEALVVRSREAEKDPHWSDSAEFIIHAVLTFVARFAPADDRSLQTVRDIIGNPELFKKVIDGLRSCADADGLLARLGDQLMHYQDKELSSVLTTCNRFLKFLDSAALQRCTGSSTFDPAELKRGRMTVFLILAPEHFRPLSPLLRMWISSLLRAVVSQGLDESRKVHFVLDEAASLGHLESIDDAVDKYRGYGVRLLMAFQSMGQLNLCFPDGRAQTLLSNATQIFAGVNDQQTAEYVSSRLGEQTIVVQSGGSTRTRSYSEYGPSPQGVQVSQANAENWQQQARKLLKPEEVIALPPRQAITFTPGLPPLLTTLVPYFEEPWLYRRSWFHRLRSSCDLLLKAAIFLILGLLAAGMMTEFLLDRTQSRQVQQPAGFYQRR